MFDENPYSVWEMRRFIMVGLCEFTPQALYQLLETEIGVPSPQFKLLVHDLLLSYCSRFFNHTSRWMTNGKEDPVLTLQTWHLQWEGFHADEPWHACVGQRVRFFYDSEYLARTIEMEDMF